MSPPDLRAERTVQVRPSDGPKEEAAIGRLAAAARVEDRPVEDDERRLARSSTAATRAWVVRA